MLKNEAHRCRCSDGEKSNNMNKRKNQERTVGVSKIVACMQQIVEEPHTWIRHRLCSFKNQIIHFVMHFHRSNLPGTVSLFIYCLFEFKIPYTSLNGCREYRATFVLFIFFPHLYVGTRLGTYFIYVLLFFPSSQNIQKIHMFMLRLDSVFWLIHFHGMVHYYVVPFVNAEMKEEEEKKKTFRHCRVFFSFPLLLCTFFSLLVSVVLDTC